MKWMKRSMRPGQILAWLLPCLVLAGCLYPEENRTQRQVPVQQWIEEVQRAVDAYQKETQVLPILSKEAETPIYAKYPIDFKKLDGAIFPGSRKMRLRMAVLSSMC